MWEILEDKEIDMTNDIDIDSKPPVDDDTPIIESVENGWVEENDEDDEISDDFIKTLDVSMFPNL